MFRGMPLQHPIQWDTFEPLAIKDESKSIDTSCLGLATCSPTFNQIRIVLPVIFSSDWFNPRSALASKILIFGPKRVSRNTKPGH